MKSEKLLALSVIAMIMLSGCTSKVDTITNPCKTLELPKWTNDNFVGVSRITASGNRSQQVNIAIQRAISTLLMTKGVAKGSSAVQVIKEFSKNNTNESYSKKFNDNSNFEIEFENIKYDIKLIETWENPCTKEIYVKIEEN